jgi:multiple antibiotic resistance protein
MNWSGLLHWTEYSKLLIGLIVITDPIGSLPVVLSLTARMPAAKKMQVVGVASLTFVVTLLSLAYLGTLLLRLFGITMAAFQVAGGILFLFYGLEMVGLISLPRLTEDVARRSVASLGVVPIGIPMLAGPGTISRVIIASGAQGAPSHKLMVGLVVLLTALIVYVGFRLWLVAAPRLGIVPLQVIKSIMGLLLSAIAVEFVFEGIAAFLPSLTVLP